MVNIKALATKAPRRAKGWMGPTAGLNDVVKTKIFTLPEIDSQFGGHPTHTKTQRRKYKLQLFEIKVLGKTSGSKKDEIEPG